MVAHSASKPIRADLRDPIEVLKEEKLITVRDIQRGFSTLGRPWTTRMARRWMQRSGVGFQLAPMPKGNRRQGQHGGAWFTTRARMRRDFPDIMDMIDQENLERAENDWDD